MKQITMKYLTICLAMIALVFGCDEGIDDISRVEPGPDEDAPQVVVNFPTDGTKIQVPELIASINIDFEVTDDIEISSVALILDGQEIARFTDFKDYRRFLGEYLFDNVTNGEHVLTVMATDIDGKTTSVSVNFEKVSPYIPLYDGEILYMPFDGSYADLVSFQTANVIGSPGFAGESVVMSQGVNAYKGAADSYLTFPTAGLQLQDGGEFSAVFWTKVNNDPDRAGVLVIGPSDPANPTAQNNRSQGFRFFRENAAGMQRFKLNVGNGMNDNWFDGGEQADVAPNSGEWVHMAFTISSNVVTVYIDGQVVSSGEFPGISWKDCDIMSIMSGAPRFTGWNHLSDRGLMDELRLFNRALTQTEIASIIERESGAMIGTGYIPEYDGEVFYMPFEGDYAERVNGTSATVVGSPGFLGSGYAGMDAYLGNADSYLTFGTAGLLHEEFSASFWMNINADPDRAGILVVGPPDPDNMEAQNKRTSGFRFFREGSAETQRFKLNVGTGDGESWIDGGEQADVVISGDWVHFAFTISTSDAAVFINGNEVARNDVNGGVDWTDCDIMSIMSGAPRFVGWNHRSDISAMDDLMLFNRALAPEEIRQIMTNN